MSYDNDTTSTSFSGNVVVGNVGNQTHTQITDNAIIFGEGTDKQVTVDASGIHVGKKRPAALLYMPMLTVRISITPVW